MKLKTTLKIKKLFIAGNYHEIKYMIMKDKSIKLTKREINILAGYALDKNDTDLMFELFRKVDYNTRKNFIRRIYTGKKYAASSSLFTIYFDEFLTIGLEINNAALLYHLAVICSCDYENHSADTFILNGYFRDCDDFNIVHAVSKLEHFNIPNLKQKIVSTNPECISEHILSLPLTEVNIFINEYISGEPDCKNISIIANILNKYEEVNIKFIHAIAHSSILPNNLKSAYLLAIFKANQNSSHHKYLIDKILKTKDYPSIKDLMGELTKEEQNKYVEEALTAKDLDLIVILATTTDCVNTVKLIIYVLALNNLHSIACVVSNLSPKYLFSTLAEILNSKGKEFYLTLVEYLHENNMEISSLIDYLCTNNLLYLYDIKTATHLLNLLDNKGPERK